MNKYFNITAQCFDGLPGYFKKYGKHPAIKTFIDVDINPVPRLVSAQTNQEMFHKTLEYIHQNPVTGILWLNRKIGSTVVR